MYVNILHVNFHGGSFVKSEVIDNLNKYTYRKSLKIFSYLVVFWLLFGTQNFILSYLKANE